MAGEGNVNGTNNRAAWNEFQKAFLVELLVEFNRPGMCQQNAWSTVAWNEMMRRFKTKFIDSMFTEQECTLKKHYKMIKPLRDQSGFGWDPTRKMVEATEEVWAALLQTDKDGKMWMYCEWLAWSWKYYYANRENQFDMDSPSPIIHALGGLNHTNFNENFLNTQAFDPISTEAQVLFSTQAPIIGDTPPSGRVPSPRRTNKTRKRKAISEFYENYLAYKKEGTSQYCVIMEKNAIRSTERAEKFSVAAAIEAYQNSISGYEMTDFVFACDMFIPKPETCEAFICIAEERLAEWIKLTVNIYKSKQ